jgi:YHS domain-containing protein
MKRILSIAVLLFPITTLLMAQNEDVRKKNFNIRKNIALEGYDPVSYFDRRPQEGKEEISFIYQGITYRFATPGNMTRFRNQPEKYEPAYGGWCAYAMGATGEKVKIDPETYKILEGKLYVFYNFWGNNTLTDWNKNERQLMTKGDQNWKKFTP